MDDEDGDPPFARVAAVHWPSELTVVGREPSESRFAYLPARLRLMALACAASVLPEAATDMGQSLANARHTLATSLADHEWRRWQQHMRLLADPYGAGAHRRSSGIADRRAFYGLMSPSLRRDVVRPLQ